MNRTVLVTGAAGGIGGAVMARFAREGWRVIGLDMPGRELPGPHRFVPADVGRVAGVETLARELVSELDELHALVNNAAVQTSSHLVDMEPDEWDRVIDVNLRAPYLLTRALFPLLRDHDSAVVNVSSVHAQATSQGMAAYAASKGGLVALTRAMALELAPHKVRANAVLPGAVDTGMLRAGLGRGHLPGGDIGAQLRALGDRTPVGRVGRPEEIAEAILFLADPERSSFMTGQALVVDGGATARLSTE